MNIWLKLRAAVSGCQVESAIDEASGGLPLPLEDEAQSVTETIIHLNEDLAVILARRKLSQHKCKRLKAVAEEFKNYINTAGSDNDMQFVAELEDKLCSLNSRYFRELTQSTRYNLAASRLRLRIENLEIRLDQLTSEIRPLKRHRYTQNASSVLVAKST